MTSTLLKCNAILIVLCIGMTMIHTSLQGETKVDAKEETHTKMTLYYNHFSAPCRCVMMIVNALELDINMIPINLMEKENISNDFKKTNPQYILPTLVDGTLVIWESHAIIVYLVQEYAKEDDPLKFPKDNKSQAMINRKLQFDIGTVYIPFVNQYSSWVFYKIPKTEEKEKKMRAGLKFFDDFLGSIWANDPVTVADVALVASISTIEAVGVDLNEYHNISVWFRKFKETFRECYEKSNQKGIEEIKRMVAERKLEDKKQLEKDVTKAIETLRTAVKERPPADKEYFDNSLTFLESVYHDISLK